MADANRYQAFGVKVGGVSEGFDALAIQNDTQLDEIRSGAVLHPNLIQVIGKRPAMAITFLDPTVLDVATGWQAYGAGETITSISGHWRATEQDGGPSGSFISRTSASGIIFPTALSGTVDQKATLQVMAVAHFATGTAWTVGADDVAEPTIAKAYYPTSIVIGADTIVAIRNINVQWNYTLEDDDQIEPAYYLYEQFGLSGSADVKDLSKVSEARFEDGTEETVTVLFTDANNPANTVSVALGTCKIFGTISDNLGQFAFTKLAG